MAMSDLDRRLFQALEKLGAALKSQIWEVAQQHQLSPIMVQIIFYLGRHPRRFCTLSNLALEFSLTKATVCEAITSLERKGYIRKIPDERDARLKYLSLTSSGHELIDQIESYERWFLTYLSQFPEKKKEAVYAFLIELLKKLKQQGNIKNLRSCVACENFEKNKFPRSRKPHLCRLLNLRLAEKDIQIDCPSNSPPALTASI